MLTTIEQIKVDHNSELSVTLKKLYIKRRMWQALARVSLVLAAALVWLCVVGFTDYHWPMSRWTRIFLAFPAVIALRISFVSFVWPLMRRKKLSIIAREIENITTEEERALTAFASCIESKPDDARKLTPEVETKAKRALQLVDENALFPRKSAMQGATVFVATLLFVLSLRLILPVHFERQINRVVLMAHDEAQEAAFVIANEITKR
jgi:hypothetical protein